jgi:hypothetical protein
MPIFPILNLNNYLLILILIFMFGGCSESTQNYSDDYPEMEFQVNSELLSDTLTQISEFEFNLPLNWSKVNSDQFSAINKIFYNDTLLNNFKILNGYQNNNSLILIAVTDSTNKSKIINNFSNELEKTFKRSSINFSKFRISDIEVSQFIATNETHTSFHLFLNLDAFYLIEFLIPLETYKQQIQMIESTIGTITKRKQE